ncbi:MAG: coproporphyrinogen III oxidase [Rhodospirillales bacterium]|nr:coproporphyrinogen III oxidase [Rhodospirillales bacterium]
MEARPPHPGFGIYIHWPFCLAKCPYCDFNSHVAEGIDHGRWRQALLTELGHYAAETQGRTATSIFFGGGTPSLAEPATIAALIDAVRRHWTVADDVEITLEANPSSVEAGRFRGYRDAGVNRVSLGVQSLDDDALRFLGRLHGVREALRAVELAAKTFPRFSFDLIYARPGQDAAAWRTELAQALALAAGHLSVYQLTIEPGTAFAKAHVPAADDDRATALFDATQEILERAGLPAYEVSNHARPGDEGRHNLTYWRGGDYVGIGPGAHGRISHATTVATRQTPDPARWLAMVESKGHATAAREALSVEARREEVVMMGLRLDRGLERDLFRVLTGVTIEDVVQAGAIERLVDLGFLIADDVGLRTTPAGRLRLNAVTKALLT